MIKTKIPVIYGDRDERQGVIMLEVRPLEMTREGNKYLVIDWDISKEVPEVWKSKEIFYTSEKINEVNDYLEENHDFSNMTKCERDWEKVKLALMLDTQTNLLESGKTIYRLNPDDWEYSE